MGIKPGKIKQSITIDKETWDKAGIVLADIGISRSRFIEITFKNLYKGKEETFEKVTTDLFGDMFESSSKLKAASKIKETKKKRKPK